MYVYLYTYAGIRYLYPVTVYIQVYREGSRNGGDSTTMERDIQVWNREFTMTLAHDKEKGKETRR